MVGVAAFFRLVSYSLWICLIGVFYLHDSAVVSAKGSRGGGGGGGRGGGGRGGGGGFGSSGSGGSRGSSGGSRGGRGSLGSSGTVKSAVGGFAAGYAVNSIGHKIGNAIGPHNYGGWYGGHYYYLGNRYYPGTASGKIKCVVETPSDFPIAYNDTGKRITEIIYECSTRQSCCNEGCCLSEMGGAAIAGIILACIIGIPVIICCIVGCVRACKTKKQKSYEDVSGLAEEAKAPEPYYGAVGQKSSPYYGSSGVYPAQSDPKFTQNYPSYPYQG